MKDHEIAKIVNQVCEVARKYHNHQSLRERISHLLVDPLKNKQETRSSWEGCVDTASGAFTQEEIDRANMWL